MNSLHHGDQWQTIDRTLSLDTSDLRDVAVNQWLNDSFTKICVRVESEEELLAMYHQAEDANLPCAIIKDNGVTEFKGRPTNTCIAIGPAPAELIDVITGNLKLL